MRLRGFTLLETLVALVVLGLVVGATLPLLGSAVRAARSGDEWTLAAAYAEEGMELAKLDVAATLARGPEPLEGGFERWAEARPSSIGLLTVTVTVRFPDGGVFELDRLLETP